MLRYENFAYLKINKGDHFGLMDVVLALEQQRPEFDSFENNSQIETKEDGRIKQKDKVEMNIKDFNKYIRRFTVQALKLSGLLTLPLETLVKMQFEFCDYFDELFEDGILRLLNTTK